MIQTIRLSNKLLLALLLSSVIASAQKLPSVQKNSLRPPSSIKVDGEPGEWNNTFQALNNATDIAYTLANDDERLYLTIQAKYHDVIDKIIRGGITFNVNHTTKRKDDKQVSVTYPVLRDADMSLVSNMFARKDNERRDANGSAIKVDDINELLQIKNKFINVNGIAAITEKTISVYNTEGIKAASKFDGNLAYTCEIVIPIKYLGLPNNGTEAFSYQIKINEPAELHAPKAGGNAPPPPPIMTTALSTTDFWAEYTLAK